jgi:hypothetical protein
MRTEHINGSYTNIIAGIEVFDERYCIVVRGSASIANNKPYHYYIYDTKYHTKPFTRHSEPCHPFRLSLSITCF